MTTQQPIDYRSAPKRAYVDALEMLDTAANILTWSDHPQTAAILDRIESILELPDRDADEAAGYVVTL